MLIIGIKKNHIHSLDINGSPSHVISDIKKHVSEYYKDILGCPGIKYATLDKDFWDDNDKITTQENLLLQQSFTLEEIKTTLFDCEPNGAPGPDGFSFKFYQYFWEVVKDDLFQLCHQFYLNSLHLDKINKSIICLIPKVTHASNIGNYRPISLVNCSFKLISKILTHRLSPIMSRIIDDSQSAFLPHRYILDNVLLGQEVIHYSKQHQQQGVIIKVDFEKAYDKINWEYLIEVLISRGFSYKWICWIEKWLHSSQSCVNINGDLTPYFYCK